MMDVKAKPGSGIRFVDSAPASGIATGARASLACHLPWTRFTYVCLPRRPLPPATPS
jgi:hypothetical protein